MRGIILGAGFGTRLRPLTQELPKPLVWVGDRPAVAHICGQFQEAGILEVALNVHHLPGAFSEEVLSSLPVRIDLSLEGTILGTAGGVRRARRLLEAKGGTEAGPCVVWNGDILARVALSDLIAEHERRGALATLAAAPARGEGTIGLDAKGRIVRMRGERFGCEVRAVDFMGIQVHSAALARRVPDEGCLVADVYLPLLREGGDLAAHVIDVPWDDLGTLPAYAEANWRWLQERGQSSFVAASAHVDATVELSRAIVLPGASVSGTGIVKDCIVWPGAKLFAPAERMIATPSSSRVSY